MDLPVDQSTWAIAFASLLFTAGIVRGLIWLIQWNNEKKDRDAGWLPEPVDSGLAANLPDEFQPKWLDVGIIFLVGAVCFRFIPILAPVLCIVIGVILLQNRGVDVLRMWQWNPRNVGEYLLRGLDRYLLLFIPFALLAGASMIVFRLFGGEDLAQPVVKDFMEMDDPKGVIIFVVLAVVVAPLWEETAFRGILYPLLRGVRDRVFAVLATGVLFGLVHGHGPAFIPLTFLGIALAWLYERSGRLGYCIGLHASFNAATAITLLLVKYAPNG